MSLHSPRLTLVFGGARSGKSRFAEDLVAKAPAPWVYIATGQALDDEMEARIRAHRERRSASWLTAEAPLDLCAAIMREEKRAGAILVDCLTLWLSNVLLAGRNVEREVETLIECLAAARGPLVAVSNEVGLGIVPESKLARDFRDAQGRLNAKVAALADHVVFVAAGLPLVLKQP